MGSESRIRTFQNLTENLHQGKVARGLCSGIVPFTTQCFLHSWSGQEEQASLYPYQTGSSAKRKVGAGKFKRTKAQNYNISLLFPVLQWYINRKTAIFDDGSMDDAVCCSDQLVSMHYVSPEEMHRLHFVATSMGRASNPL